MEYSKIKKSLKKFGLNFNNKIVKAIEDLHKDSDGKLIKIKKSINGPEDPSEQLIPNKILDDLNAGDKVILTYDLPGLQMLEIMFDVSMVTVMSGFKIVILKGLNMLTDDQSGVVMAFLKYSNENGSWSEL